MEPEPLKDIFNFHYWARDRLLAGVTQLTVAQYTQPMAGGWGSVHDTLVHMVEAEEVWLARIGGHSPTGLVGAADTPTFEVMQERWEASAAAMTAYLRDSDTAELDRKVHYTNTQGQPFSTPVWQILLHVLNHATEHRAQVSTMLAALAISHPGMDMITFWRDLV